MHNGARGSVFQCGINPGRSALALFPLPCQQAFVPPVTATKLCIGRATPLSTCGNKPACGNEPVVMNRKRSSRLRFSMQYQSRTQRPRALPAPLPTSVCITNSLGQRPCALEERHHYSLVVMNKKRSSRLRFSMQYQSRTERASRSSRSLANKRLYHQLLRRRCALEERRAIS